jgi:hypothetical protein
MPWLSSAIHHHTRDHTRVQQPFARRGPNGDLLDLLAFRFNSPGQEGSVGLVEDHFVNPTSGPATEL